ncbi:hypothetical protein Ccrd_006328 [Cynara cardunculus var. scolymus]|uniref:Uncharacterized protein n=1 Tax=Cynara cardunculus var. scolymus TaxID=59895 RepID=A0A103XJ05_CYNCS|nr:hypothetical protein Ccrd_006328 [Cynara cardunculus var. scolymus]
MKFRSPDKVTSLPLLSLSFSSFAFLATGSFSSPFLSSEQSISSITIMDLLDVSMSSFLKSVLSLTELPLPGFYGNGFTFIDHMFQVNFGDDVSVFAMASELTFGSIGGVGAEIAFDGDIRVVSLEPISLILMESDMKIRVDVTNKFMEVFFDLVTEFLGKPLLEDGPYEHKTSHQGS